MVLSVWNPEMTEITRCPECGTRFKVTDAQLAAHEGLVRCGHCHDIFDARKHLHDDEPSPQLSLPIDPIPQDGGIDLTPIPDVPELEEEPRTLAQQVQFIEELTDEVPEKTRRQTSWGGVAIATALIVMLLGQSVYYFRVELGSRLPGLRPLLEQYCQLLSCTVTLPKKIELMVLESSDLESDPAQNNIVILHALVHNRAQFAQTYPSLELTLTDLQDQTIARRLIHPAEYLKTGTDEKLGLPANRDLDIRLRMDTTDLKPSGYRLFLFYPQ
jgi:predicted Zn finger-like uncharacterized protein